VCSCLYSWAITVSAGRARMRTWTEILPYWCTTIIICVSPCMCWVLLDLVNRPVFHLCFKLGTSSDGTLPFRNEVVARKPAQGDYGDLSQSELVMAGKLLVQSESCVKIIMRHLWSCWIVVMHSFMLQISLLHLVLNVFIGFKLYGEKKIACFWIFVVSFSFVLLSANGVHGSASSQWLC